MLSREEIFAEIDFREFVLAISQELIFMNWDLARLSRELIIAN